MQKSTKKGFTLIELLVVIAIIALLLAILMPALGKAKDKAKQIVCKSHLKGIGLAIKLYLTENDNRTPEEFGGYYSWINPDTNLEYKPGDDGFDTTYWGVRFKDYAEDKKIFSCPSFAQFKINLEDIYFKYVVDDNSIVGGFGINPYFTNIKVGSIRTPSEYIITQDHVEPMPEENKGDLFHFWEATGYNLPGYRDAVEGEARYDQYRGMFRHSKKNTAMDNLAMGTPEERDARRKNTINNPNGQSDTLRLDGSVDAMHETTGENVRESWYTGK